MYDDHHKTLHRPSFITLSVLFCIEFPAFGSKVVDRWSYRIRRDDPRSRREAPIPYPIARRDRQEPHSSKASCLAGAYGGVYE